jgi:predicted AAA+ superfamily ATPase
MERLAYQTLKMWKDSPLRKPLVVQGARQVGKTFLLKSFGEKEYQNMVYLNFEENPELRRLFEGSLTPEKVIQNISAYMAKPVTTGNTLLFFDEIQVCPKALTSLKYFYEQAPEYHIVAAGSLLGVSVGKTSSFPVGKVHFLHLYPLSFFEFLQAINEQKLVATILEKDKVDALPDILHNKLTELLRMYLYTGGMPEVVVHYIRTQDLLKIRELQKDILQAYERDFSKYTTSTVSIRVSEIWQSIPAQLARENKKFKYSEIKKGGRASQFESAVEWLRGAGLLYVSNCVTTATLPLSGFTDHSRFKVYCLDCGLLGAMLNIPPKNAVLEQTIFSEYNGAFTENFIATELAPKNENKLFYWLSEGVAEVDFLVEYNQDILPLEVKSGMKRNVKSLWIYEKKFNPKHIFRCSPRNFEISGKFVNIPLYAIGRFSEICELMENV